MTIRALHLYLGHLQAELPVIELDLSDAQLAELEAAKSWIKQ